MNAKELLLKVQQESMFTAALPFDQFVSDLCKRYSRIFGEILPVHDYEYIVNKLTEKGILETHEDSEELLEN